MTAMLREFSAGAVVLRYRGQQWWVAAIEPAGQAGSQSKRIVIALPKGNVGSDERPEQAALREVTEETGVRAELIAKLGSIRYIYQRKWESGEKVFKIVTFYLMKYKSGRIGRIS